MTDFLGGADDGRHFRVIALVAPLYATSQVATLTVQVDNTAPTIVRASTDMTWTNVTVRFSEPVTDTALQTLRYVIDQGISVTAATRVDSLTIKLTTSQLTENRVYMMTVNGVQDTATPPNTIAPNTQVEIHTLVFLTGAVLRQKYTGFNDGAGTDPQNLFNDPRFPYNCGAVREPRSRRSCRRVRAR